MDFRRQRRRIFQDVVLDDPHMNTLRRNSTQRRRLRRFAAVYPHNEDPSYDHAPQSLSPTVASQPSSNVQTHRENLPTLHDRGSDRSFDPLQFLTPRSHKQRRYSNASSFKNNSESNTLSPNPTNNHTYNGLWDNERRASPLRPRWMRQLSEAPQLQEEDLPLVERALDDVQQKARHYFVLFEREKKRREKLEQMAYWFEQNNATLWQQLQQETERAQLLLEKIGHLRGDPATLKVIIERVDLLYLQLDTLVQALAGIACHMGYKDQSKEEALDTVLDYLFPCRALDPRLNALYGATYYYKLGLITDKPSAPVPPEAKHYAPYGSGTPWLPPGARMSYPEPQQLVNTLGTADHRAAKTRSATSGSRPQQTAYHKAVSVGSRSHCPSVKRVPPEANVKLEGYQVAIGSLHLSPPADARDVVCVFRYDDESPQAAKQIQNRVFYALSVNQNIATFNELRTITDLPPKLPNVIPSFCFDIWSSSEAAPLGTAKRSFVDPDTLSPEAKWPLRDTRKEQIGFITISIGSHPPNAMLPAVRFMEAQKTSAGSKVVEKDQQEKGIPSASQPSLKKKGDQLRDGEPPTAASAASQSKQLKTPSKDSLQSMKARPSKTDFKAAQPILKKDLEPQSPKVKPPHPPPQLDTAKNVLKSGGPKISEPRTTAAPTTQKLVVDKKSPTVFPSPKILGDANAKKGTPPIAPKLPPPAAKNLTFGTTKKPASTDASKATSLDSKKTSFAEVTKPATVDVKKTLATEPKKLLGTETKKPVSIEIKKPATAGIKQQATVAIKKPAVVEIKKPAFVEIKKPGVVEIKKPANIEIKKPGVVEIKKPVFTDAKKQVPFDPKKQGLAVEKKPGFIDLKKKETVPAQKPALDSSSKTAAKVPASKQPELPPIRKPAAAIAKKEQSPQKLASLDSKKAPTLEIKTSGSSSKKLPETTGKTATVGYSQKQDAKTIPEDKQSVLSKKPTLSSDGKPGLLVKDVKKISKGTKVKPVIEPKKTSPATTAIAKGDAAKKVELPLTTAAMEKTKSTPKAGATSPRLDVGKKMTASKTGDNAASITGKKPKGTSTKAGLGYKGKGATKEIPYKEKGKVIALPKKKR